ncbi:MAG: hypothetical protein HKN27_01330 [Silicimonas sp.]|nr:hypothetical protein [Silicimonas sp.]
MSRPSPFALTGLFVVFIGIFGGLIYLKGGLYIDSHEGDVYHLLDVSFRMMQGQTPHLDFVTPLGIFAFLPLILTLKAGLPFGAAFIASQFLVSLLLLPAVVHAVSSRLSYRQAVIFGCVTFGLVLTMTYLHATSGVTVAMHYNRWAWAVAFIALLLAFFPTTGGAPARPRLDGVLIGALATVLLLTKITFFVGLAPAMLGALLVRRQATSIAFAFGAGVILVGLVTLLLGVGFWQAYLSDLLNVVRSDVRPDVGLPFSELLSGAQYLGVTVTAIFAALMIRRAGHDAMALVVVFLLLPGFMLITYQNFGNDPTWLLFLAFLVLAYRPRSGFAEVLGVDLRAAMNVTALVAVVMNLPSIYTSAIAPLEHFAFDERRFMPFLDDPAHADFFVRRDRASLMTASIALDEVADSVWAKYREPAQRADMPEVGGVTFPMCELGAGSRAYMIEIAAQLKADGIPAGTQFFSTGLLSAFWLYADFEPLQNGAPWYYGDLTGLENADYVLIPKCVYIDRVRGLMINELLEANTPLTLRYDNALYALFSMD